MNDNRELIKSLTRIHKFNERQINAFLALLKDKTLDKKDYLLKEGQTCNFLAFVKTGSLRSFTLTDSDEMTLHFFTENQWVTEYQSLTSQIPSENYIQATELTELKTITLNNLHLLLEQEPEFRNILKVLGKNIITSTHLKSVVNTSPDERYRKLLRNYPEWINRFPQMHIASYLGMTKETFSRVKARVK